MDMLAYTPVEFNYLEILVKTFIIPVRQSHFIQKHILSIFPVSWIAIAMNKNTAFTGSYTEIPFWYQQFDLRHIRILRGGLLIVDFAAADNCSLYVTTMEAMDFQDDIPSIPNVIFKNHYIQVFGLTSLQDAAENCHYPDLVWELLGLELYFIFHLEHVVELVVLGERISSVAVDKLGVVGKNI